MLSFKIKEFRFIKAAYESRVTWRTNIDYLRCSPKFNEEPRYDNVLVNTTQGIIFAQLVFVFTLQISSEVYPIALIQPFKRAKATGATLQKDKDLRFFRLRKQKDVQTEFIFVRSIVCGVVLVPARDKDKPDDYLVFDVMDSDMLLRIKELLNYQHPLAPH